MTRFKDTIHRAFTDPPAQSPVLRGRKATRWSRRYLGALVASKGWTPEMVSEATGYDVIGLRSAFSGSTLPSLELVIRLHGILPDTSWDELVNACKPILNEYLRKRREHRNRKQLEIPQ